MRQLSTKDQTPKKLATIGHHTAFNNEQSPYRIFSYKWAPKDKCKQFKRENQRSNVCPNNLRKTNM